jgi:hypothetical protein
MKASEVTSNVFDAKLEELLDGMTGAQILAIQGVYKVIAEEMNNDVLMALNVEEEV